MGDPSDAAEKNSRNSYQSAENLIPIKFLPVSPENGVSLRGDRDRQSTTQNLFAFHPILPNPGKAPENGLSYATVPEGVPDRGMEGVVPTPVDLLGMVGANFQVFNAEESLGTSRESEIPGSFPKGGGEGVTDRGCREPDRTPTRRRGGGDRLD